MCHDSPVQRCPLITTPGVHWLWPYQRSTALPQALERSARPANHPWQTLLRALVLWLQAPPAGAPWYVNQSTGKHCIQPYLGKLYCKSSLAC